MPILASGQVKAVEHKVSSADAEPKDQYDYQRVTLDDGRGTVNIRLNDSCQVPEVGQQATIEVGVRPYRDRMSGELRIAYRGFALVDEAKPLRVAS